MGFLFDVSFLLGSSAFRTTVAAEDEWEGLPEGFGLTIMVCGTELDSVVLRVVVVETRLSNRNESLFADVLFVALFEVDWFEMGEFLLEVLDPGGEVSDTGGEDVGIPATPVGVLDPELVALEAFPSIRYTVRRVPAVPRFRESVLVSNLQDKKRAFISIREDRNLLNLFLIFVYYFAKTSYPSLVNVFTYIFKFSYI